MRGKNKFEIFFSKYVIYEVQACELSINTSFCHLSVILISKLVLMTYMNLHAFCAEHLSIVLFMLLNFQHDAICFVDVDI